MRHLIPDPARGLAEQLHELFGQDAALARRLNDAQRRLARANEKLWCGLHPDAFAGNRSEVLGAEDPLAAVQQAHWQIHRAFHDYQAAAEERRQLAADAGEVIRQFVGALLAAGWSEEEARNANVGDLAHENRVTTRRN